MAYSRPARDVAFGKAVVARRFATAKQVEECFGLQHRYADEKGDQVALSRIMLQRDVITREQAVVAIEDVLQQAASAGGDLAAEIKGMAGGPPSQGAAPQAGPQAPKPASAQPKQPAPARAGFQEAKAAAAPPRATAPEAKAPPPKAGAALEPAAAAQATPRRADSSREIKAAPERIERLRAARAPKEVPVDAAAPAAARERAEGEVPSDGIPGYRILEKIGSGSMGTVYKAHQTSMDRLVALKVLPQQMTKNEAFVNRFLSEARSAGRLNHPNVIRVHEVGRTGGIYYYSMEYVAGESLDKLIRRAGKLDPRRCHKIMLQVAQALDHGHKNGIVHRELRPEAIMVDAEDQTKLADLGITKVGSTKFLMGTNAQYVAPEQVRGAEVDIRTDIYSFGCTFFDALVGKPPFRGNTPKEILSCQISEEPPDVAELAEGVPEELADVIATCMEKSPEDRYQIPLELIEDLQKVSFKQSKSVRKLGGKTPSGRFISRRHRAGRRHRRR